MNTGVCAINVDEFAVFSPPADRQRRSACCVASQRHRALLLGRHAGAAAGVVDTGGHCEIV